MTASRAQRFCRTFNTLLDSDKLAGAMQTSAPNRNSRKFTHWRDPVGGEMVVKLAGVRMLDAVDDGRQARRNPIDKRQTNLESRLTAR